MNETESDAQASYFIYFSRRRINSDNLHSAAIIRCERAQKREMRSTFLIFLPTGILPPWELVSYADCILCV